MNVRDLVNQNSAIVTIVAVLFLMGALTYIIYSTTGVGRGRGGVVAAWYFDEATQKLFAVEGHTYPPIKSPFDTSESGELTGVRAHVYACGECDTDLEGKTPQELAEMGVTIGYLERFTDEAKQMYEQPASGEGGGGPPGVGGPPGFGGPGMPPGMMFEPMMMMGRMVRPADQPEGWYDANSPAGIQIQGAIRGICPSDNESMRLRGCRPK